MAWNLVALEPDAERWQSLRPVLARLGHRAVAVDSVSGVESVLDAFEVESVLIRPIGDIDEHRRLANHLRAIGTRVFVTADGAQPRILSLYYALGDQTRTVRPEPLELVTDLVRHARSVVDRLPPVPEFGSRTFAANDSPVLRIDSGTERAPSRPRCAKDVVAPQRLRYIRMPAIEAVG